VAGAQTGKVKVAAALRQRQCVELRAAGASYRDISATLGVSPSTAYKWVCRALAENRRAVDSHTDDLRAQELDRLDRLQAAIWAKATSANPDLKAVDRVIRIMERRARMLGLDKHLIIPGMGGEGETGWVFAIPAPAPSADEWHKQHALEHKPTKPTSEE